ncbi:MAG: hypothetical protein WBC65_02405, partial [Ignavibacteria bacterium]
MNGKFYKILISLTEVVSKPNHSIIPVCLPLNRTTSKLSAVTLSPWERAGVRVISARKFNVPAENSQQS